MMSLSLAEMKRRKNFKAVNEKGYPPDPEGFPLRFLMILLKEEVRELENAVLIALTPNLYTTPAEDREEIIKECADVSNFVDYIHSKVLNYTEDKYIPEDVQR